MSPPSVPLDAIRLPALLVDPDGRIAAANDLAEALAGQPLADLSAGKVAGIFGHLPDGTALPLEDPGLQRAFAGAGAVEVPLAITLADGRTWNILATASPIRDGDRVTGALVVVQDATGPQLREELAETEAKYRNLVELSPDAILIHQDGIIVFANPAAADLFGLPGADSLLGRTALDLVHPEHRDEVEANIAADLQDRESPFATVDLLRPDGTTVAVQGRGARIPFQGRPAVQVVLRDVTDQQRAEAALRRSEEEYRHIVEYAPTGIYEIDYAGPRFRRVNDAMCRILGYTREELLALDPGELLDGESRARFGERVRRVLAGEPIDESVAFRLFAKDGREIWGALTVKPTFSGGVMDGALVVAHDVTALRRVETALRESERRLRDVLEISLDVVYRRDLVADRYDYLSPVIRTITGYAPDEFAALGIDEVMDAIHPDDRGAVRAAIEAGAATGSGRVEYRFRHRDGDYRWVSDYFVVQRDGAGRPVLRGGVLRDVTERKELAAALEESEERLRLAQEGAGIAVWDWEMASGAITYTPEFLRPYGVCADSIRDYDSWRRLIHPGDLERVEAERDAAIERGEPFISEFRVVTPSGEVRWVAGTGFGVRDPHGRLARVMGVNMDITARKEAETERARFTEELQRSNEELQRFAYVASHDLQEPLRSIVSFSQLLERRYKGKLDADADEFIEFIVEGGTRMQTLIQDLLQLSRVETRASPLVPTDAAAVVADVLRSMETSVREAGATVEVGPMPTVMADAAQLAQVFTNLVGNALKYRRPDGPPAIRITAGRDGRFWRFAVSDNGIGIAPEYFDRIFVIFQRLHTKDAYPGTGIGLAVARKIVERHGGRIWVESTPGEGSTFSFTLPAA